MDEHTGGEELREEMAERTPSFRFRLGPEPNRPGNPRGNR